MSALFRRDRRLRITPDALGRIVRAIDPEHRVLDLYDRLIVDNDRIGDADKEWRTLTRGQQVLIRLAVFDMEVCNGGIEQYFWNRPDQIFEMHRLLETLDVRPLTDAYERALQQLAGKETPWLELLDLQGFDSAYYGEWDGYGTKLRPGLGDLLGDRLRAYVLAHPTEFCTGTRPRTSRSGARSTWADTGAGRGGDGPELVDDHEDRRIYD